MNKFALSLVLACSSLGAQEVINGSRSQLGPLSFGPDSSANSVSIRATAGSGGVTANLLAAKDASSPTQYVLPSSGGCGSGIAATTATSGNPFELYSVPGLVMTGVADNSITAGHVLIGGTGTPGRVRDSGQTDRTLVSVGTCIVGVAVANQASAGSTVLLRYDGPSSYGTSGTSGRAAEVVSVAFSATPTFTCGSNSAATITTFVVGALTANITSSTLANCTTGQTVNFVLPQDSTGGRLVTLPSGFPPAIISPTASKTTMLSFTWDGTTARYPNSSDDTQSVLFLSERSALGTPAAGSAVCWPDSTDHAGLECKANNSASLFKMILNGVDVNPVTGQVTNGSHITNTSIPNSGLANSSVTIAGHPVALGGTQALASTDLSDTANINLLNGNQTISGNKTNTGVVDSSGASRTAPAKTGTSLPGTCTVGDLYFKSDATAGQNIYECQSTNTWTQQLNSGGGGAVASVNTMTGAVSLPDLNSSGNVTKLNAGTIPASASVIGTNGSGQPVAATAADISATSYVAGGGTAQAQTAAYSPAIGSLTAGTRACWLPTAANTAAAPTFAPNGLTAHTVVKAAGAALVANDIITTAIACAIYDATGTQWELQNPQTSTGGSTPSGATGQSLVYPSGSTASAAIAYTQLGSIYLPNATYPKLTIANAIATSNDYDFKDSGGSVYTVPANRRLACLGFSGWATSSATLYPEVKISGSYYGVGSTASVTTGTSFTVSPYILETGQGVAVNDSNNTTFNAQAQCVEFDNTVPLKTAAILSPTTGGDRTVYTTPAGGATILAVTLTAVTGGLVSFSPANNTFVWKVGSFEVANPAAPGSVFARQATPVMGNLASGDVVTCAPSASTSLQQCWVNVLEH